MFACTTTSLTASAFAPTMPKTTAARRAPAHARTTPVRTHARLDSGVGCFGSKAGMTQMFTDDGLCVPVTVIGIREGNFVTMVKTEATDGYNAVQVGYDVVREDKLTKPKPGTAKKAGTPPMRHLEEFRLGSAPEHEVGARLVPTEMFKAGDKVDVRGATIGKGFQGAVKRYGFSRGLMTHGSKSHRQHGSIGAGTTPGRIYPGKRMHGHMGNDMTTVKGLTVMRVEDDCIIVKGNVPGKKGSLCKVTGTKIVGKSDGGASKAKKSQKVVVA